MTTRERIRRALTGEALPDRIPLCEIGIWPETADRWRTEGMPADVDPLRWLDMDPIATSGFDCSLRLPTENIAEDEETVTVRDADGTVVRSWKTRYAVPVRLDYLIKTPDDWVKYRDRLEPTPDRLPADYADVARRSQADDAWLALTPTEPIWWVLMALGFEGGLPFMADYPDVVEEMVAYQTRLSLYLIDQACAIAKPDAMWYFSDLCYKNGMLFSPRLFRERFMPYIKQVADACWERDVPPMWHCDGNVSEFIPLMIEAGFACIQPLEARAGNDVRDLKPRYDNQITLFGNISIERLSETPEEAEAEVAAKVAAAMPGGRYMLHSDHSVPPTVSLENYRRAIETGRRVGTYS
jgi:uroporphyrinogen decarboxylase